VPHVSPCSVQELHAQCLCMVMLNACVRGCRLLEVQRQENGGQWPETIAVVLWGTDNIKTYGESLAQVYLLQSLCPLLGFRAPILVFFCFATYLCDCLHILSPVRVKRVWRLAPANGLPNDKGKYLFM
jgi:hypothetical protein